jgi:hypothetical protein
MIADHTIVSARTEISKKPSRIVVSSDDWQQSQLARIDDTNPASLGNGQSTYPSAFQWQCNSDHVAADPLYRIDTLDELGRERQHVQDRPPAVPDTAVGKTRTAATEHATVIRQLRRLTRCGCADSETAPGSQPQSIMFSRSIQSQPLADATIFEQLPPRVRSFLFESERRVVEHCLRLLQSRDLAADDRQRLVHLVKLAETHLQRLDGNQPLTSRVGRR